MPLLSCMLFDMRGGRPTISWEISGNSRSVCRIASIPGKYNMLEGNSMEKVTPLMWQQYIGRCEGFACTLTATRWWKNWHCCCGSNVLVDARGLHGALATMRICQSWFAATSICQYNIRVPQSYLCSHLIHYLICSVSLKLESMLIIFGRPKLRIHFFF